jgi:hypothetical protein
MDDEIKYNAPQHTGKWEDGEYEAFLQRFRWQQEHGESHEDYGDNNSFPRREH